MIQNPNAIGAAPAQGNPQAPNPVNLPADQVAALRNDPDIIKVASSFMGRPTTLEHLPEAALVEIAGMVHKLGVQGAVQMLEQKIPADIKQKIKSAV